MEEYLRNINAGIELACSRLSDSGEDAKEQGTRKVGGAGKRKKFPPELFSCLRFLNSADPTISEPATGQDRVGRTSKNSLSGISKVSCSRRSDRRDTTKRCEEEKTTTTPSFPPYFFLALFLRAALHSPNDWNRLSAKILPRSLEATCRDLVMGLKFPALTHLPCEACTITIMIKIITIIILKLIAELLARAKRARAEHHN